MTCFGNAARSLNLQNMTIFDLDGAKENKDFDAMCVRSPHYKTSLLYGEKKLLFGKDLYKQLKYYVKYLRPLLTQDQSNDTNRRFIFTSSVKDNERMTQSTIANALTRIFEQSGALPKNE